MINERVIAAGAGCSLARAKTWAKAISSACAEFSIASPVQVAAFLAQIGHESGRLAFLRELWGPTAAQKQYEPPAAKAKALGNTEAGDGFRFRGRGLIQITGRDNYRRCGQALGLPLELRPELLESMEVAARSAAWFWREHGLNALADRGDFDGVSDVINRGRKTAVTGDALGYPERVALYRAALAAQKTLSA